MSLPTELLNNIVQGAIVEPGPGGSHDFCKHRYVDQETWSKIGLVCRVSHGSRCHARNGGLLTIKETQETVQGLV